MAELELTRPTGYRTDHLRAYQIYIDGQWVEKIKAGESKGFALPPGRHELQLKQDWASSEKLQVDLGDDDRAQFVCAPRIKENDVSMMVGLRAIYWTTLGCRRYIDLRRGDERALANEPRSKWNVLNGPKLFGIALLIGIAYWVLTGQSVVATGVVIAGMAFVVGGLVGRGIGNAAGQISKDIQKRRGD